MTHINDLKVINKYIEWDFAKIDSSNTGVGSSIERVSLADGKPDPIVAYAPHGYDLVTDTDAVASASNARVEYIYDQIKKKGEQLKMPIKKCCSIN